MSSDSTTDPQNSFSEETIYEILSNRRRRFMIHILKQADDTVELTELSRQVAAWETGTDLDEVSYNDRHSVYTTIKERHLPMLVAHNLVTYDSSADRVAATPALAQLDIYVETLQGSEIPWSLYYLGIASLSVLLLFAVVLEVPGLVRIGPTGVSLFTIAVFAASGIVHYYHNTRSQLGSMDVPPEVQKSN